jgi:galactokinase
VRFDRIDCRGEPCLRSTCSRVVASAPGRVDLLNTHQDYKGLPVVPASINLRTYVRAEATISRLVRIRSIELQELGEPSYDEIPVDAISIREGRWFGNYFRAILKIVTELGARPSGADVIVKSQVPIASGLASSASLEVSFLMAISTLWKKRLTTRQIAELAFRSENVELGIPCGRLDQYGSAFGGMILLHCRPPFRVERLHSAGYVFSVLDSGVRHSTAEVHSARQRELNEGVRNLLEAGVPHELRKKLAPTFDRVNWAAISEKEIEPFLETVGPHGADRILFTLRTQKSTRLAVQILKNKGIPIKQLQGVFGPERMRSLLRGHKKRVRMKLLGEMMNYQHELLRDLYDLSVPELESIRFAALDAGAYGVKISGAGLGGSLVALVDSVEDGQRIVEAAKAAGAKQGWTSTVGRAARIERGRTPFDS